MKRSLKKQMYRDAAAIPAGIETKSADVFVAEVKNMRDAIIAQAVAMKQELKSAAAADKADLEEKHSQLQRQVDALDQSLLTRHAGGGSQEKTLLDFMKEDEGVQRLLRDGKGTAIMNFKGDDCRLLERKTTIDSTAVGASTSGVLQIDRSTPVVTEARQQLYLRNLLTSRPTSLGIVDFVKVSSPMAVASLQIESAAKLENAETFTTQSEKVQTIATWIPASSQVLSDMAELAGVINSSLMYAVNLREEISMLYGSGSNELHGVFTQASAFNTSLVTGAWSKLEIIAAAIAQISIAKEVAPTFVILNPVDWLALQRIKTTTGEFILGNPQDATRPRLWGLDVLPTVNMSSGMFLVGSGNPAAIEVRDALEMRVEVSNSHSDFFTKNLVAIRAEKRCALVTKRPGSFIAGTLTTSP